MGMFSWLGRKGDKPVKDDPFPGEKWEFDEDDPFPQKFDPVLILDVKKGWVRYSMGKVLNDERMKMSTFKLVYRKVEND